MSTASPNVLIDDRLALLTRHKARNEEINEKRGPQKAVSQHQAHAHVLDLVNRGLLHGVYCLPAEIRFLICVLTFQSSEQ